MANLLYVTCNLSPVRRSRSLSLGARFLDEYLRWNPRDDVHVFDTYRDNIQRIDADVLSAREKLGRGESFALLSEEERRKVLRIWRIADQFVASDKYVFVTPAWNLSFPAEFKMYIDAICEVGKTYRLTEEGAEGLLRQERRKSLHIHAPGALRCGEENDSSIPYLRSVLNFLGVRQQETVLLEGSDDPELRPVDGHDPALKKLLELAARF